MIKIIALRDAARERMGDRFDTRGFREGVLRAETAPLSLLEEPGDGWSAARLWNSGVSSAVDSPLSWTHRRFR